MDNNDYINTNAYFLKLLNKEEAIHSFSEHQPEKQQLDTLKQEIEQLQSRIKNNEEQKNKLQGSINYLSKDYNNLETSQKKETEQAKQFCNKRDNMLASLPPSVRKKAMQQFKILAQSETELKNVKTGKLSETAGFLTKLLHRKKLQAFDQQFEGIKKDLKNGELGNFDISSNFDKIANNINQKYDRQKNQLQTLIAERKKELSTTEENIKGDKKTLETKEKAFSQNEKALDAKISQFSNTYDTHPFVEKSNLDSKVKKALDSGQIQGSDREKQIFASLLSTACQNSDIAKDVLHTSIDKGTKFFIQKEQGACGGHYSCGVIVIDSDYIGNLNSEDMKVAAMASMIHEARHSCQDNDNNIKNNNWANTLMQSSFQEVDAYSIEVAATYQLNQNLGTHCYQSNLSEGHEKMLKEFSKEYEQNHDIPKALNAAALQWDKEYGFDYKSKKYIQQNWCHLDENATTVHPQEIAQRNNINFQGKPYLDIEKVTNQILTLDKSDYDEISHKLEASGKKDDSLQYLNVKVPDFKRDEKGNILMDEFGMNIIEHRTIEGSQKFTYPSEKISTNQDKSKSSFYDMTPKEKGNFIQKELRQGKNFHLEGNKDSITQTKAKPIERPNIISPLRINRGMEM